MGTLVLCGAVVYLAMAMQHKSRLTKVQLNQTLAAHAISKERQVTSLFYVTIMVPCLGSTQSMQTRVLVLSLQHLTQKEPLAHVLPLFYMTWVMMQMLTSWKACMCSMPSLKIVAEMGVHMCCNWESPGHWVSSPHLPDACKQSLPGASMFWLHKSLYFVHHDTYMHTYIHIFMHVSLYQSIHTTHVWISLNAYIHVYRLLHVCLHTYILHTNIPTSLYIHTYT